MKKYSSLGKCKLKPQWDVTSHLLDGYYQKDKILGMNAKNSHIFGGNVN
jgi:hypothetical protein